jgi:nucleoside-diphosphate-sugar epimerase
MDLSSGKLSSLLKDVECVFHLAAQPGVRASWGTSFSYYVKDNIIATQRLLEAVKSTQAKMVYASSSSIYGDSECLPTPEETPAKPVSPYGATKLAAEHLCRVYFRNYGVSVVSLRYFTVYGPRQRPDMAFKKFISGIFSGREIQVFGDGEQRRDFTYVKDIVAGNLLAIKGRPGTVYNVGAGQTTSLNDVITTLESIIGKEARVKKIKAALGDVRNTSADITDISRDLGYRPTTTLMEGLRQQVKAQFPKMASA